MKLNIFKLLMRIFSFALIPPIRMRSASDFCGGRVGCGDRSVGCGGGDGMFGSGETQSSRCLSSYLNLMSPSIFFFRKVMVASVRWSLGPRSCTLPIAAAFVTPFAIAV